MFSGEYDWMRMHGVSLISGVGNVLVPFMFRLRLIKASSLTGDQVVQAAVLSLSRILCSITNALSCT